MKLDATGKFLWERVSEVFGGDDALEMSNHELYMVRRAVLANGKAGNSLLTRVDTRGNVTAQRILAGDAYLVRTLGPTSLLKVATMDVNGGPTHFYSLSHDLKDAKPPIGAERIEIAKAFELEDQSWVIFGSLGRATTANVARVFGGSLVRNYPWEPLQASGMTYDAVAVADAQTFAIVNGAPGRQTYLEVITVKRSGIH
jgi:hypothetical protein